MPVISTRRYSTSTGSSSLLPPSIGGTTSSLAKTSSYSSSGYVSNYRSSSLSNSYSPGGYTSAVSASAYIPRTSSYRSSSIGAGSGGTSSIYRHSSYLTGGNNDTTAASRFGVSSNRYIRSSSDRDTSKRVTGKTQYNNNNYNTIRSKPSLQTKPPIAGTSSSISSSLRNSRASDRSRDNSLTRVTSKSDPNSNCVNSTSNGDESEGKNYISQSLSSSSLARQVATSGLDLYEKYSPAHYIPKCELSRSRSLSEATSNKYSTDKGLSNSSNNVHQLLQTKEVSNKQQKQENETLNIKSSSPSHQPSTNTSSSSSSKDISTAQLASKVKLCAVSTAATNNPKFASSFVVISNNNIASTGQDSDSNANAYSYLKQNSVAAVTATSKATRPATTPHYLADLCLNINAKTHLNNSYSSVDITRTTNSITSVKPICSVVNIVTNPSEHDSHKNRVLARTATATQSDQLSNSTLRDSMNHPNSATTNSLTKKLKNFNHSPASTNSNSRTTLNPITSTSVFTIAGPTAGSTAVSVNSTTSSTAENANAILKAAKSNLKPTKQSLLSKIDDKTMTSYYFETNGNFNANSEVKNNKSAPAHLATNANPPITSTFTSATDRNATDKAKFTKFNNNPSVIDSHLEFYRNKLETLSAKTNNTSAINGPSSKISNSSKFIGLKYREPNFLENECELARSQVAKTNESENNNQYLVNGNNNSNSPNPIHGKLNKYEKNLIKPLVHKTTNVKFQPLSRTPSNNNMNCLQSGSDLDDIKFIDSDDSERHHSTNYHSQVRPMTSAPTSKSNLYSSSPSKMLADRKDLSYITSNKVSTLPLTSRHHRDLIFSDSGTNKSATTSKYNTLNDFKRIPTSLGSGSLRNSQCKVDIISSSSSSSPSSSTTTPVKTFLSNGSASIRPSVAMVHQNGTVSHESTPSSSPQTMRRRNALNSTSGLIRNSNESLSSSPSLFKVTTQQQPQLSSLATAVDDKVNLSNKLCDTDESVRNVSIRSGLPSSPTPSRYWDREGRSSALAGRSANDNEDSLSNKSSILIEGLCGLRNIGNTCYMNSVIQCLSHTRELTKFLKSQLGIKSANKDQQILIEFAKLIREMWSPNIRSVTPLELKSAFSTKHRMYSGYNQQDAQEFLRFFLDSLHCALNSGVKGETLEIDESLSDNKKADLTWERYCKVENSVIRELFVGQLKSTLKCTTCGNTSVTFDPFWDLSVSLPSLSRCKLDSCFDLFIREEVLDGDEMPTCSKCQTRRKCTKSFTIQRFPKYLVIHLKRFSETRWSKLSNVVEFPTGERELNMAPYASSSNISATYSLYGISNHMGSTAGGHYVALCKHPVTKKWHEFNDNVVSDDLSESVLVSSSAYLLFYERA